MVRLSGAKRAYNKKMKQQAEQERMDAMVPDPVMPPDFPEDDSMSSTSSMISSNATPFPSPSPSTPGSDSDSSWVSVPPPPTATHARPSTKPKAKPTPRQQRNTGTPVTCVECGEQGGRFKFESTKKYADENDQDGYWEHKCPKCVMVREGLENAKEAAIWIYQNARLTIQSRQKRQNFLDGVRNIEEAFPALATQPGGKTKIVRLLRNEFSELWVVLGRHIWRKKKVMEEWAEGVNSQNEYIVELRTCEDPVRQTELVNILEKLQEDAQLLAFADREDQQKYIQACSYSDEWLKVEDSQGNVVAILASYYICLGQNCDQSHCLMLIPSKDWNTNGAEPVDCKRWYCNSTLHWKRYMASWGQVVIVHRWVNGQWWRYYMRAKVPDWNIEDIRAMDIEERIASKYDTPEDVYNKLDRVVPTLDDLVVPAPHSMKKDSVRICSYEALQAMPWFAWDTIYSFVNHEPKDEKTKKMASRLR